LVTTINNKGQPALGDRNVVKGPLEQGLKIHDRLLNSITTLLVRNYNNIATAVNSSYKALESTLRKDDESDDESDDLEPKTSKSATKASVPRVIVVTNPRDDDNHAFDDNLYLLEEKGKSHIGERFGDWDVFLAIP